MKIVNCGYDYHHPDDFKIYRPFGSGDFILLVLRSPAFFWFKNEAYHTKGNAVVLFQKGTPQIYGADGQEYINDWIHFEADPSDVESFLSLGIGFDEILEFQSVTELTAMIRNMCYEKYSNNRNSEMSANLYFHLIMMKISDMCNHNINENKTDLLNQLTALRNDIFSRPGKEWQIGEISKELSISSSYLQHQYKLFFKTSIKGDITSSRIEYAKYLLFSTDYTIGMISQLCGYKNEVHFMRIFKDKMGYTPTEYRKQSNYSSIKVDESKKGTPFSIP